MKVTGQDEGLVIQSSAYDALGRRVRKVVTNSGDLDGTTVYYYRGHQIIETRDGSGGLTMQVYHGTQYIDEVAGIRTGLGRFVVHQDANWNVMALTDLAGRVVERYHYSPYGELEVSAESYPGDYTGDGRVDSDDDDELCALGGGCDCEFTASVSGACRVFDFDCDGDLDQTDQDTLEDLYDGLATDLQNHRIPSTTHSPVGNPFAHQGLAFDAEIGSYQNRARQYGPKMKRFMQRDAHLSGRPKYTYGMSLYSLAYASPLRSPADDLRPRSRRAKTRPEECQLSPASGDAAESAKGGECCSCGCTCGEIAGCCDEVGSDRDARACYACQQSKIDTGQITTVAQLEEAVDECLESVWGAPPVVAGSVDAEGNVMVCVTGNECKDSATAAHESYHKLTPGFTTTPQDRLDEELNAYCAGMNQAMGDIAMKGLKAAFMGCGCNQNDCPAFPTPGGPADGGSCPGGGSLAPGAPPPCAYGL